MRTFFKNSILAWITVLVLFGGASGATAHASGEDAKLIIDGETYYLSTEVAATISAATTSSKTAKEVIDTDDLSDPPRGYVEDLGSLISFALQLVIVIALLLVLFMFVTAGIEWITSGGDKGKTENARNKIVAAVVGTVILAASYALVQLVAYVLGFESFNQAISNIPQIN